jgi:hypothetical protein
MARTLGGSGDPRRPQLDKNLVVWSLRPFFHGHAHRVDVAAAADDLVSKEG